MCLCIPARSQWLGVELVAKLDKNGASKEDVFVTINRIFIQLLTLDCLTSQLKLEPV